MARKNYGNCPKCGGPTPKDIRAHYCPAEAENLPMRQFAAKFPAARASKRFVAFVESPAVNSDADQVAFLDWAGV